MPDKFFHITESVLKLLPALALAVLGGLVKLLKEGRHITTGKMVGCILTAFFAGSLTLLFIQDLGIQLSCKAGIIGVSGFAAGEYLTVLSDGLTNIARMKLKFNKKEDDAE